MAFQTTSGNLFAISASEYGDADQWIRIMESNNLTDPFIRSTTPVTLLIPAKANPDVEGIPTRGNSVPMIL